MIYLPYLISTLIGLLTINLILKKESRINFSLNLLLALGLGLGISGILTFICLAIDKIYNPKMIITFNLLVLFILGLLNLQKLKQNYKEYVNRLYTALNKNLFDAVFWIIWFCLYLMICFLAQKQHPFGEWDAWAIWNLKLKFLLFSETPWPNILRDLHPHTHPDYPLLLPCINAWVYTMSSSPFVYTATMKTSVFYTMGCAWLLYAGTAHFIRREFAYLISLILLLNPYFIFLSTSQYADVILAFYLLAGIITLVLMLRQQDSRIGVLCGFCLGLMSFIKNEGFVMAGLLLAVTTAYVLLISKDKRSRNSLRNSILSFCAFAGAAVYFKIFMAPANHDILPNMTPSKIINIPLSNLLTVIQHIFKEIIDKRWCYVLIFNSLLILLGLPKLFYKEIKILTLFLIFYCSTVIFIYVTSSQVSLEWWITSSLRRIFQTLLPSLTFMAFYLHWRKKDPGASINNE